MEVTTTLAKRERERKRRKKRMHCCGRRKLVMPSCGKPSIQTKPGLQPVFMERKKEEGGREGGKKKTTPE